MEAKYKTHLILGVILLFLNPAFSPTANLWANESSKYLDAVREFADNVLKYGRDTYGKHTPLFVDGLMVRDPNNPDYGKDGVYKPVEWIAPNGDRWILSNLASQQNLFRTLDGLTSITVDPKYKQSAMDAIEYAFENLRSPNGLLYWGHSVAYDAKADDICGRKNMHTFKLHYPYYELMWRVNPGATKQFIESFWSAHIIDWSNLDMDRIGYIGERLEEPWNHAYDEDGPTFFESKRLSGVANYLTGSSLVHGGIVLHHLSGEEQPLIWSERLIKHFVDTRHPKVGISALIYNNTWWQLGEDMKEHFIDPHIAIFPWDFHELRYLYYPEKVQAHPWLSILLVGRILGEDGDEFTQWALEEFTAWGKVSYRRKDNSFVPILTDGTNLEGYIWEKGPGRSTGENVIKPYSADTSFFWAYSVVYSTTGDEFMWEMVRDIALGNNFGDIGETSEDIPELQTETCCSEVYGLLGFLQLYEKTSEPEYLNMARRIGDNILLNKFHKGFFVPSKKHIYTRFDCLEPLALLHLDAAMKSKVGSVPSVWPSVPLFVPSYRHKEEGVDRRIIYTLTESPEPPVSLQEAAAIGNIDLVRFLIENGTDVNVLDDSFFKTALHRAAISGHRNVAELLLAKGADVDARSSAISTPLHYAVEQGHKEITELLIAKGADVNAKKSADDTPLHSAVRGGYKDIIELLIANGANVNIKNSQGQTPLDMALTNNRSDIVELLVVKGADVTLHTAVLAGDLAKVKSLIEKEADINAKDASGSTPLHYAVQRRNKDIAELLITSGADVNAKDGSGDTCLHFIAKSPIPRYRILFGGFSWGGVVKSLINNGSDVNMGDSEGRTPLWWALERHNGAVIELLRKHGARE